MKIMSVFCFHEIYTGMKIGTGTANTGTNSSRIKIRVVYPGPQGFKTFGRKDPEFEVSGPE
jgi:hypothetical protein